jgi:hypothetical protein
MKPSTGLSIAAVGAILAFAVRGHPPFVNCNAAGWVLIFVGVAGLFTPPGTHRRLRQRLILRDGKYGPAFEATRLRFSRHLMPGGILVPGGPELPVDGAVIEEDIIQE